MFIFREENNRLCTRPAKAFQTPARRAWKMMGKKKASMMLGKRKAWKMMGKRKASMLVRERKS